MRTSSGLIMNRHLYHFLLLLIPLSVLCQQRQHFRVAPEDQEVKQGTTAVIKCEVGNQGGRVQWAKDGFVLGFNRSIPTNHRYQMVGEPSSGTHHLRILNATLVDDADFQCQVGPADGHDAIRETGHLTVLMAPTRVSLKSRGQEETLEVTEGDQITLECLVEEAKPVASVVWYKNDRRIMLESRTDDVVDSKKHRRHDLISKVIVDVRPSDDEAVFSCQAEHPALQLPKVASVRISVLYPPGPPSINGYSEGETVKAGELRTLSCASRGGNPPAKVDWYRNGAVIDSSDRPFDGGTLNEMSLTVNASDNGAVYICRVSNKLTTRPLEQSITLDVQFPPRNVIVSGPKEARVGQNVTLSCLSENSNPPALIQWVVDGHPQQGYDGRSDKAEAGGWDTISFVSLVVPSVDTDMLFICHATNHKTGETKTHTYVLSVLRPPNPPVLHGYSEGAGLLVGKEQSIQCVSRGGNPPANLQWYKNGEKISSEYHVVGDVSTAEIFLTAQPSDNGVQYRCEASNSAASSAVSVSTTLIVHYPPDNLRLSVMPQTLSAGTLATLTCTSGESNPQAIITWMKGPYELQGKATVSPKTEHGGVRVTSELKVNLTSQDDGLTYTCEAKNLAMMSELKDSIPLSVKYSPEFINPPSKIIDIKVGESRVLNLTAKGNPSKIRYLWNRLGSPLSKPVIEDLSVDGMDQYVGSMPQNFYDRNQQSFGVKADGPILYLRNIQIEHGGEYELEASNNQGSTIISLHLNVQYPPKIHHSSGVVSVAEGEDAVLECIAEGNPLTDAMMKWQRRDYDFVRTRQIFDNKKTTLTVLEANKNDTGVFTCHINNGIGAPSAVNVTLIVRSKPQIDRSKMWSRAATPLATTGMLTCIADGAPQVRFSWRREGLLLSNGLQSDKYDNETSKIGLIRWKSSFFIRNVNKDDYGYYECVAENELGASPITIQFTPPTRPEPPMALRVLNTTHDSVLLSWSPGFNGGMTQYFRLRYRPKDSSDYQFYDVYEAGVFSQLISGLELDTEYYFSIMSYNDMGESEYRGEFVRATTDNLAASSSKDLVLNQVLGNRSDVMPFILICLAVFGTLVIILYVAICICIVRRKRCTTMNGSEQGSSKSTTNTMYAPSSYNETVVGETLSSISEKSRESFTPDDSVGEYEVTNYTNANKVIYVFEHDRPDHQGHHMNHKHGNGGSSYLIDQIEPPPEYASQTPSSVPSSTVYNPHEDDYAEVLRRNAYNHQLGKLTPRPQSRATHYSVSPDNGMGNPGPGVTHSDYQTFGDNARNPTDPYHVSYSYTPSPTPGIPNGGPHGQHAIHMHSLHNPDYHNEYVDQTDSGHNGYGEEDHQMDHLGYNNGYPDSCMHNGDGTMSVEASDSAYQNLGLDHPPPPPLNNGPTMTHLDMEQHSMPSEPSSLNLDPNSITIDHHGGPVSDKPRILHNSGTTLSTFHPPPSIHPPPTSIPQHMEGHLV